MYFSGQSKHVSSVFQASRRSSMSFIRILTLLAKLLSLRLWHTNSSLTCPWYVCLYAHHSFRNRGYSAYFPLNVGHPLSFAWAPIRPRMRLASSSPAPVGVALGGKEGGGQVETAGVLCGGRTGFIGKLRGGSAGGAKSPMEGLIGNSRGNPVSPLISEMSYAAPNPLRAALISSRLALMASPTSLTSS